MICCQPIFNQLTGIQWCSLFKHIKHPENEKKSGNFNSHESSTENTIIGELGKPCNGQRPFSRSEFTSSTLIAFNVVTTTSDQYDHVLHDLYPPVMFLWNKHKLSWLYTNDVVKKNSQSWGFPFCFTRHYKFMKLIPSILELICKSISKHPLYKPFKHTCI